MVSSVVTASQGAVRPAGLLLASVPLPLHSFGHPALSLGEIFFGQLQESYFNGNTVCMQGCMSDLSSGLSHVFFHTSLEIFGFCF